jgi:hypothetical protein
MTLTFTLLDFKGSTDTAAVYKHSLELYAVIPSFNVSVTLYALKGSTEILRNPTWEVIWVFLYDLYKFCFSTFKHVALKEFMYFVRASL